MMKSLYERIKNKEKLCGTIASLTDPCICEIFGKLGYDYVWIDMEHTYMSYKEVLCHLNAARSAGISAIVRVPENDLTATKKILEMDVDGIIFPMVRTEKQARELIETTLYPPYGARGFGPMRAIGYGVDDTEDYISNKSKQICRFIQIEHIDCIQNLEEIVKIDEIDGFIFGPNDLSGSLGQLGRVFERDTAKWLEKAVKILKKHGKYIGLAGGDDEKTIAYWSALGVDMLTAGADWLFIGESGKRVLDGMRKFHIKQGKGV